MMVDLPDCRADFLNACRQRKVGSTDLGSYGQFFTLQVAVLAENTANRWESQPLRLLADCHRMGRMSSFRTVREIGSAIRIHIDRVPH